MKFLLVVACFFVATYGRSVEFKDEVDAEIKGMIDAITTIVKARPIVLQQAKETHRRAPETSKIIDQMIAEHKKVLEAKEKLKTFPQCKEIFDKAITSTTASVKQDFLDDLERSEPVRLEKFLIEQEEKFEGIKQDLTQNLDKLLEDCEKSSKNCKITEEYEPAIEEYGGAVELLQETIPDLNEVTLKDAEEDMSSDIYVNFRELRECFGEA